MHLGISDFSTTNDLYGARRHILFAVCVLVRAASVRAHACERALIRCDLFLCQVCLCRRQRNISLKASFFPKHFSFINISAPPLR